MTPAGTGELEKNQDEAPKAMSPTAASRHWQLQIHLAEKTCKEWWDYGVKVEARYKSDKDSFTRVKKSGKKFAILYSNTETLKTALYARTPKPDVRRRYGDKNPVARTVAEIVERALGYCADNTGHDRAYRAGVHDMTLPGRGVVRLKYEAELGQVPEIDPMTGQPMMGMDGQPVMAERITEQEVEEEHVYWKDFLWEPGRAWRDVTWIAFRHRMTRDDLKENGFENPDDIPMNWQPEAQEKGGDAPDEFKRAEVWEVWCKKTKKRYWIVKGYGKAAKIDDDPYELDGFWPMAEPLSAILGTDSFVPAPFYCSYEDQADDLDEITGRISMLVKALRRRGVYDSSVTELKRLSRAGDNEFIPVDGAKYNLITASGGLKQAFQSEDIKPIADVLVGLYEQRDRLIAAIYEISGISDIIRGSSNPNETATAQNIKAQFGSMRLRDSQREVQRWVRDSYRIKAELICQNFEPEKLAQITGMDANDELFQQAIQVLRSDDMRGYQVDIETDSTVFEDAEAEKNSRVEFLTAMGGFIQQWIPVVQAVPEMAKLAGEFMSFGVRGFHAGRGMEDVIEETMAQVVQRVTQQAQQPPPPDPAIVKAEAEMKRDEAKHQLEMQGQQMDLQVKEAEMGMDMQANQMDLAHKQQTTAIDLEKQMAIAAFQREARKNAPKTGSAPRKQ
jgi:hypothetical protein